MYLKVLYLYCRYGPAQLRHSIRMPVSVSVLWPNYGLCGGSDGTGREGKRKAAVVLVLLAKDVVSLQINTEIGKS